MLVTSRIEDLRNKSGLNQVDFCEKIGLTKNGYKGALDRNDFKVSTLTAIADFFKVPIVYFFDEENETNIGQENIVNEPSVNYGLRRENDILRDRIKDLEKIIELLENKLKTT